MTSYSTSHRSYGYDILFHLSISRLLMMCNSTCPQVFFLWHLVSFILRSFVYCIFFHLSTDLLSMICYSTCLQIFSLWPVIPLVHISCVFGLIIPALIFIDYDLWRVYIWGFTVISGWYLCQKDLVDHFVILTVLKSIGLPFCDHVARRVFCYESVFM